MSEVARIAARYIPPRSVYLAELKASELGSVATRIARATLAFDAHHATGELERAERALMDTLNAVRSAIAEIEHDHTDDLLTEGHL